MPADIYHRSPLGTLKLPVDPADRLFYLALHLPILAYGRSRRRGHLYEGHLSLVPGMGVKEPLERKESVQYPLRVVQAVDSQYYLLHVHLVPKLIGASAYVLTRAQRPVVGIIYPDGERPDPRRPALVPDGGGADLGLRELLLHRVEEVGHVGRGVEAEQVRSQQSLQHLSAPWDAGERLPWGEGDVPEECYVAIGQLFAEGGRHQGEVHVLQPYRILWTGLLQSCIDKSLVDLLVGLPVLRQKPGLLLEQVAYGPYDAIGEAIVVLVDLLGVEPDPPERIPRVVLRNLKPPFFIGHLCVGVAAPPCDPNSPHSLHDRI